MKVLVETLQPALTFPYSRVQNGVAFARKTARKFSCVGLSVL